MKNMLLIYFVAIGLFTLCSCETPTLIDNSVNEGEISLGLVDQSNDQEANTYTQTDCNIDSHCKLRLVKTKVFDEVFNITIPADTDPSWLEVPVATVDFRSKKGLVFIDFSALVSNLDNAAIFQIRLNGNVLCGHTLGQYVNEALRNIPVFIYPDVMEKPMTISHRLFGTMEKGGKQKVEIFAAGCCSNNASNVTLTHPIIQISAAR